MCDGFTLNMAIREIDDKEQTIRLLVELAEEQSAELEQLRAREAERQAHMRAGLERLRPLPAFREDDEEHGDV